MIVLSGNDISVSFGGETLFHDVNFRLEENGRAGLVGVNGCGKTTALNIIAEKLRLKRDSLFNSGRFLNDYLDMNAGQKSWFNDTLKQHLAWHCTQRARWPRTHALHRQRVPPGLAACTNAVRRSMKWQPR